MFYDMAKEKAMFSALDRDVMMDKTQIASFLSAIGNPVFCVLAEDREYPIHSVDEIPARWNGRKNGDGLQGHAQPGEYYAFQLGVYASKQTLKNLHISVTDLVSANGAIASEEIFCVNFGGIDAWGNEMTKVVDVDQGRMQPLWISVPIPKDAGGNCYAGSVAVAADGLEPITVNYTISVSGEVLEDGGDSEPWRHSRLRWLNSKIAVDDELTAPFTPLTVEGDTIKFLGRKLTVGKNGLPARIESFFDGSNETLVLDSKDVLSAPIRFVVDSEFGKVELNDPRCFNIQKPGLVTWQSESTDGNIVLCCEARLEYDGYMEFKVSVEAKKPTRVTDISLVIPYTKEASKYKMGLGNKGSYRNEDIDWKWDATLNQDTLWMGDVNAGLMVRLKGVNYEKPYMLIYYHYKPLNLPECWHNDGKGGVKVCEKADSVDFCAYSGERTLMPGEKQEFMFDLCVTPVKTINKQEHWNDHYFHAVPEDLKVVSKSGANIINIHHANEINPFINYPFYETEKLANFVKNCHDNSIRAKIYYTIKEITVRMTEIWAIRSLGDEVIPYTYEIGESFQGKVPYADEWLARYFKDRYMTAWRQKVNRGSYVDEMECSVVVAPMSRFNNYFLEGLKWILDNTNMDGLYFDDVAFDRTIMKRLRKIMDRHHVGCTVDLHSWNYFKNNNVDNSRLAGWGNSMNLYIDNFAFIDRLWFGEGFDYAESPDFWLTEMSGIPFGMMGEMLQNGGNVWRGMVYGMTCRLPNDNDPSGVWKLWKDFGMANATMLGYWNPDCPVKTTNNKVLATVYKKPEKILVSIASWDDKAAEVSLDIDFTALGLDPNKVKVTVPEVRCFQQSRDISLDVPFTVEPGEGFMMVIEEESELADSKTQRLY